MTPWLDDGDVRLYLGDVVDVLRGLPDESVHMACCSPPFYGLRDYGTGGTGAWEGGDDGCDHAPERHAEPRLASSGLEGGKKTTAARQPFGEVCGKCGAQRVDQQIGLEATPDQWVARLVDVFREVRRVLRSDGTLWVEIGDSYATQRNDSGWPENPGRAKFKGKVQPPGTKQKDLIGAPWLLAFALRADGWVLRNDNVWSRPNPMPESVTDRTTKSHSYVFMFSKATWRGPVEPWPMAETDKVWLAAMVDGEGTICFQERANKTWAPTISPRLSVVNTNRSILERVAAITGLNVGATPSPRFRKTGEDTGRPIWTWQVTDVKAARIIAAIRPHLIAKAKQADLAIYVYALNKKHKGRGGHRTTDKDLDAKRKAASACSELNRTGDADLSWFKPVSAGRWVPNDYMYDAEAVREPHEEPWRSNGKVEHMGSGAAVEAGVNQGFGLQGQRPREYNPAGRNRRSVWTIATQPYPEAHFATWPEKLVEPMILAGTSERGVCPVCGAPWERVTDVAYMALGDPAKHNAEARADQRISHRNYEAETNGGPQAMTHGRAEKKVTTTGWRPTCECSRIVNRSTSPVPATVLDPFAGSGTTCHVARRLGRRSIGVDLNADYLELAARRLAQQSLLTMEGV